MLLKGRTIPSELLVLRYLSTRMELTEKDKMRYFNLEKGFEGELKLDQLLEDHTEERYIINDLLLEINNSHFQIDTLIISQEAIYLIDVKNFQGDYCLEAEKLYSLPTNREYKNPITQLKRSESLFRQLLQNLKVNYLTEASVIFINPEFTLFQAPPNLPMILPTQISRFFKTLNNTPSILNDGHKKLAQTLISLHQSKNPYSITAEYNYDKLQKGVYCKSCNSFLTTIKNSELICRNCGGREKINLAVLRNIEEFKMLFPERKITTQSISEWCNVDLDKRTFRRILQKNYTAFGKTKDTYYE